MDYSKVLKQAWKNVISYRALWIFGVLLALTTASASSSGSLAGQNSWKTDANSTGIMGSGITLHRQPGESWGETLSEAFGEARTEFQTGIAQANRELSTVLKSELGLDWQVDILKFLTVLLWIVVILYLVGKVFRYISETALIKMVDDQERTGEQRRGREGFRMGWSRTSWRLFLIDLVIDIPTAIVFLILFALVFTRREETA